MQFLAFFSFSVTKYEEKCSIVSCLFYQSLLSANGKPVFAAKKDLNSRWVKPWRRLPEAKGETSTFKMGKFCYNATDINVFVLVRLQNCQRAKSARRLSPQGGDVIDENGEKARGLDLQNIRPFPFFFV